MLFMQRVQDLSVEDCVSRTQFQYTLEDPSADELNTYAPRMIERLKQVPQLRDVASDQQVLGLRAKLVFDRDTASRLGISPSTIDQTLYDAYGQREVSTMFTQLNQYHVVLEVKPDFQQNPLDLRHLYIRSGANAGGGVVAGGSASVAVAKGPVNSSSSAATSTSAALAVQFRSCSRFWWRSHPVCRKFSQRKPSAPQRLHSRGNHYCSDHSQSPGSVPRRDSLVQFSSRCVARRCCPGSKPGKTGDRATCQYSSRFPRYRPSVPGFSGQ
jgi:hypothetical protein